MYHLQTGLSELASFSILYLQSGLMIASPDQPSASCQPRHRWFAYPRSNRASDCALLSAEDVIQNTSGYEVSLQEFTDLCVDDHENFAPLLREWFWSWSLIVSIAVYGIPGLH